MDTKSYKKLILCNIIKKEWIDKGHNFILQEDRDSSYTSKDSRLYKEELRIEYYFTLGGSPDLTAIKTIVYMFKIELRKQIRTTKLECINAALFAWEQITQEKINSVIMRLPVRYRKCLDVEGQMTCF